MLVLFCLAQTAGCADEQVRFDVRYAPGFSPQSLSLSVFGVFKDGRLSADAWDEVFPKFSPWLGAKECAAAYDTSLLERKPALADAIDDDSRANGVTDEMLDKFGPLAKGDAILTLTMAGESAIGNDAGSPVRTPSVSQPARGRGGRGRRSMSSSAPPDRPRRPERGAFEMAATIYSVRLHRSLAVVSMTYLGARLDDAVDQFRRELEKELPRSTCAGWNWDVDLDPEQVRGIDR